MYNYRAIIACLLFQMMSLGVFAQETRELIILPEREFKGSDILYDQINLKKNESLDIALEDLIFALTANYPIIVSASIWRLFNMYRKKAFELYEQPDGSLENTIYRKYIDLITQTTYNSGKKGKKQDVLWDIIKRPASIDDKESFERYINILLFSTLEKGREEYSLRQELLALYSQYIDEFGDDEFFKLITNVATFASIYVVLCKNSVFDVYEISENEWYIILPKSYMTQMGQNISENIRSLFSDFSREEQVSGMHLSMLNKINIDEYMQSSDAAGVIIDTVTPLHIACEKLFIRISEEYGKELYPFVWNIFLTGHGSAVLSDDIPYIDNLHEQIISLKNQLIDKGEYRSIASHKMILQNKIEEMSSDIEKIKLEQDMQILTFIEQIYANILAYLKGLDVKIASLPIDEFQFLLDFFEDQIKVGVFSYMTCHAGDRNLLYPYISLYGEGQDKNYSYVITSGTISDTTYQLSSEKYSLGDELTKNNIVAYMDNNAITMSIFPLELAVDYKGYFDALRHEHVSPKELSKILSFIYTPTKGRNQKPVVRYANQSFFMPLGMPVSDNSFNIEYISKVSLSALGRNAVKIVPDYKDVILGTYFVPRAIQFDPKNTLFYDLPTIPLVNVKDEMESVWPTRIIFIEKIIVEETNENDDAFDVTLRVANSLLYDRIFQSREKYSSSPKIFVIGQILNSKKEVIVEDYIVSSNKIFMDGLGSANDINAYKDNGWVVATQEPLRGTFDNYLDVYNPFYNDVIEAVFTQAEKDNLQLIDTQPLEDFLQVHKEKVKERETIERMSAKPTKTEEEIDKEILERKAWILEQQQKMKELDKSIKETKRLEKNL